MDRLLDQISSHLRQQLAGAGVATRTRHQRALEAAAVALDAVTLGLDVDDMPVDLLAEDLRIAIRSLDSLIGRVDVENVLGEIFSSFCIGK
jgi:tRNA modification GTPase